MEPIFTSEDVFGPVCSLTLAGNLKKLQIAIKF